jgi:hypothetical protein
MIKRAGRPRRGFRFRTVRPHRAWPADAEPSVAVARKLAVIMHRMWVFGSEFKTGVERPGLATA